MCGMPKYSTTNLGLMNASKMDVPTLLQQPWELSSLESELRAAEELTVEAFHYPICLLFCFPVGPWQCHLRAAFRSSTGRRTCDHLAR